MRKDNSLTIISEENLITKIIRSLKSFLRIKQTKEEPSNRTASVITAEKIKVNIKREIGAEELRRMEEKILADISYIDSLNEDELNSLDDYYDSRIAELEHSLSDKKSKYFIDVIITVNSSTPLKMTWIS